MKAQSSLEFLAYISISMLLLAGLTGVVSSSQSKIVREHSSDRARAIADRVSFNLEMALVQGEGYSRLFDLPGGIGGSPYQVEVIGRNIRVSWKDRKIMASTRYTGKNFTLDSGGTYRVVNNVSGVYMHEK